MTTALADYYYVSRVGMSGDGPYGPCGILRALSWPGGIDRPLNGVLRSRRAEALGLTPLRPWRGALADYMGRAGLAAAAAR